MCYLSNVAVHTDASVSSVIKHLLAVSASVRLYLLHMYFWLALSSAYCGFPFLSVIVIF